MLMLSPASSNSRIRRMASTRQRFGESFNSSTINAMVDIYSHWLPALCLQSGVVIQCWDDCLTKNKDEKVPGVAQRR